MHVNYKENVSNSSVEGCLAYANRFRVWNRERRGLAVADRGRGKRRGESEKWGEESSHGKEEEGEQKREESKKSIDIAEFIRKKEKGFFEKREINLLFFGKKRK